LEKGKDKTLICKSKSLMTTIIDPKGEKKKAKKRLRRPGKKEV